MNTLSDNGVYVLAYEYKYNREYHNARFDAKLTDIVNAAYEYEKTRAGVKVQIVTGQPYTDLQNMSASVDLSGVLQVSSDYNNPAWWSKDTNLKFRATHDLHHIRTIGAQFNLEGEILAYKTFNKFLLQSAWKRDHDLLRIQQALIGEIVAQVAYLRVYGDYPPQRRVLSDRAITKLLSE